MSAKTLSGWLKGLAVALLFIAALRLAMPFAVQWYINDALDKSKQYTGSVGDIDLMLWQGAYSIEDIVILKRNGQVDTPFFEAQRIDFSVLWSALLDKAVVGSLYLTNPTINFVDGKSPASTQSGKNEDWISIANGIVPLKIDRIEIENGNIRFINPDASPPVNLSLHDISAVAKNLVNSRDLSRDLVASLEATGKTEQQGSLTVSSSLDPSTEKPTFDINLKANDVALVNFKNFLDTYAPFDLEAGTLELALELASENGKVTGYAKPILYNLDVFSWKGDIERDNDGFFQGLTELMSGFFAEILENQSKDQVATRIPIEGEIDNLSPSVFPAIGAMLKNAFIQALSGDLENSVTFSNIEKEEPDPPAKNQTH